MLYFFVYTGLRLQELLNLEKPDVNLASREILVRQGKGQKDRVVPIHPRLAPVLNNYLADCKNRKRHSRYFFTGAQSDNPMSGKDVRSMCKKLSRDTELYFTPHMLRHTFGRLMVEADVDVFKIKEIMGHSSITTTMTYLSVSSENLKSALANVDLL